MVNVRGKLIAVIAVFVTAMSLGNVVFASWKTADLVLGQPDLLTGSGFNSPSAYKTGGPVQARVFGSKLFVVDATWKRVLIYNSIPTTNSAAADVVIGQTNMTSASWYGYITSQDLDNPNGVFYDSASDKLFIADTNNNRILVFNGIPTSNYATASAVIGQTNFTSEAAGTTASTLSGPGDMYYDQPQDRLYVADSGNNRVLIYTGFSTKLAAWPTAISADLAIGQANLTTGSANRGGTTNTNTFNNPLSVWVSGTNLFISDMINHRVVMYGDINAKTTQASWDTPADGVSVLGQANDTGSSWGTSATNLIYPTGVYCDGTKVYVADRSNNRALIFNSIPTLPNDGPAADVVIGQPNMTTSTQLSPGATTLVQTYSAFVSGTKLIVTSRDSFEDNRVMVYNTVPTSNGASADVVIGASSMTGITPWIDGKGLSEPNSVYYDSVSNKFMVADGRSSRVILWNSLPTSSYQSADLVIGQTKLTWYQNPGAANSQYLQGANCAISNGTKIFITEGYVHRCSIWDVPTASFPTLTNVIGQANATSGSSNQGGAANLNTLSNPNGMAADGTKLFIADQSNNRVLIYNTIPTANNTNADVVVGQPDGTTTSAGTSASKFSSPSSVAVRNGKMAIVDYSNNRVLIYNSIPTSHGASADVVIGQPNKGTNTSGLSAYQLSSPNYVWIDEQNRLFIADTTNIRVLVYKTIPTTDGASADYVIGQSSFTTNSSHQHGYPTASTLRAPMSVYSKGTQVWIVDAGGGSGKADHRIIRFTYTLPVASSLTASRTSKGVELKWTGTLGEMPITGYNVYRSTSSGGTYTKLNSELVTTSSYTDTTIKKGTNYYYKVTAYDGLNFESDYSNTGRIGPSTGSLNPDESGEILAYDDPLTKIIIEQNTTDKRTTYTIEKIFGLPEAASGIKSVVMGYEFTAKETDTGRDAELKKPVTIVLHYDNSSGVISNPNNLAITYWDGLHWVPLTSNVTTSGVDITVRTKTKHLSIYGLAVKIGATVLRVAPNPVTPKSSDSTFNRVTFTVENTNGERVEVKIWDITGVLVRTIEDYGVSQVVWDCRNEYGDIVEGGVYIYQIKVGNSLAGRGTIVVAI